MIRKHRTLLAALLLGLLTSGALWAVGEGRFSGTVKDEAGNPVAGAKIIITSPGSAYRQEKTTNDKGKFNLMVVDAGRKYMIRIEKEGFAPMEGPLPITMSQPTSDEYTLIKAGPSKEELAAIQGKNSAVAAYNEGVGLVKAEDLAGAAAKFEQAFQLDPTLTQVHSVLAELYFKLNKFPEAIAAADKYLATNPADTKGLYALKFDAYHSMGDKEKSDAAYQEMLQKEPGHETAVRIFNLGAEAQRKDDNAGAIKFLKQALELDPTLDAAYGALGTLYLRQKDYKSALDMADQMLAKNAKSSEGLSLRYETLKAMGKKAEAQEALAAMQASAGDQTAPEAFKQGVALYNANNVLEAEKAFERALAKDPTFAKAHYLLGLCHASRGEMAEAREHVQTFLKMAPNDPDVKEAQEILAALK